MGALTPRDAILSGREGRGGGVECRRLAVIWSGEGNISQETRRCREPGLGRRFSLLWRSVVVVVVVVVVDMEASSDEEDGSME